MADGLLTTTSGYNPFSFLELWTPAAEATKAHLAALEQYDELLTNTAILESLANTDPNSEAYKQYRNYYENLQRTANELGQLGLSPKVYSLISNMRKLYGQDIIPVLEALKKRTEFYKRIKDLQDRDESVIFDLENPQLVSIDLFTKGEVPLVYASGDKARDLGVAMGSSVSLRIHTFGQKYGLDLIYLTEATGTPTRDILVQLANSNRPEAADAAALVEELNSMIGEFQGSNTYLAMGDRGRTELMNKLNLGIDIGWKYDIRLDYRNRPREALSENPLKVSLLDDHTLIIPVVEHLEMDDLLKGFDTVGLFDKIFAGGQVPDIIKKGDTGFYIDEDLWATVGETSQRSVEQIARDLMLNDARLITTQSAGDYSVNLNKEAPDLSLAISINYTPSEIPTGDFEVIDSSTPNRGTYTINNREYEKALKLINVLKNDPEAYEKLTSKNWDISNSVNIKLVTQKILNNHNKDRVDKGVVEMFLTLPNKSNTDALNFVLAKAALDGTLTEVGVVSLKDKKYNKGKLVKTYNVDTETPVLINWLAGDSDYFVVTTKYQEGNTTKTRRLLIPSAQVSTQLKDKHINHGNIYNSFNEYRTSKPSSLKETSVYKANKKTNPYIANLQNIENLEGYEDIKNREIGRYNPDDLSRIMEISPDKLTIMLIILYKKVANLPLTEAESAIYNAYNNLSGKAASGYTTFTLALLEELSGVKKEAVKVD